MNAGNADRNQAEDHQAKRTPNSIAVTYEGEELTYGQLNRCVNRLAHRLRTLGIGPDVPAAVCVDRSAGFLIAVLGILKAGGAYLPLNPKYPKERLEVMLRDSQVQVLLTQEHLREMLPECTPHMICLDPAPLSGSEGSDEDRSATSQ